MDYKLSPACQRRITEKQIYDYFIMSKAKRQINISEKMRKEIEHGLGYGKSNIFDECILHCAESLSKNFWLDFAKQLRASDKKGGKPINKDVLAKAVPKYMKKPILTFFGRHSYKTPRFFLQDDKNIKAWLIRSEAQHISDLVIGLLKIDPDIYFTQNLLRVMSDRPEVISYMIGEVIHHEQSTNDNKAVWRLKDGFPLEVMLYFTFHCSKALNKVLRRIVEGIYVEANLTKPGDNPDSKKIVGFLQQIVEELVRPKDETFRKVRLMLFQVHLHCRELYGKTQSEEWILQHGVINVILMYILRCLDDPSLVGFSPMNGLFARPTINTIREIFELYSCHPEVVGTLDHKNAEFKELYNQFLKMPNESLAKLNNWYSELVNVDYEFATQDYNRLILREYNKLGFSSIGECFLYEDEVMFIGQHLITLGDNVGERNEYLQKFLDENNNMTDLRLGLKKLQFPVEGAPVKSKGLFGF